MKNEVREARLISCSKEEWDQISKILKGRIPENQFDGHLFVNSKDGLSKLKASSFKKIMYDDAIKFYLRLSHELGLDFKHDPDVSDVIDIQFNKTLLESNNYEIFVHLIKMNSLRVSNQIPVSNRVQQQVETVEEI